MKISAPKGTHDILPGESGKWIWLENILRQAAGRYGFSEIRFPAFEHTELFLRGIGDTTDVVQKEMYTFQDKGGRSITLRPEGTASTVRAFVEHGLHTTPMPFKCYYIAPNFRYENPQKGRLRQHHQFGVECFGAKEPSADAEIIALGNDVMANTGLQNVSLRINSVGCPSCRPGYNQKLIKFLENCRPKLCQDCNNRLSRNPMRILDCKNENCRAEIKDAPVGTDSLCDDCSTHMEQLKIYLEYMGISFDVDPSIVRGLDYYTKTVFEFINDGITLCGGGRYDDLVRALGGPVTPGLGFGCGLERLLMMLKRQNVTDKPWEGCDIYIAALGVAADRHSMRLCNQLRSHGFSAERDICGRGLKAQMKHADKIGARYTFVLGEHELTTEKIELKDMATGQIHAGNLEISFLEGILGNRGRNHSDGG
ncbi:MAG: histidine--tRNA ligase [Oscillospiraceae bacterium]|nr:histidine--tRNA ligase [Oscillospiraceae bacterium]